MHFWWAACVSLFFYRLQREAGSLSFSTFFFFFCRVKQKTHSGLFPLSGTLFPQIAYGSCCPSQVSQIPPPPGALSNHSMQTKLSPHSPLTQTLAMPPSPALLCFSLSPRFIYHLPPSRDRQLHESSDVCTFYPPLCPRAKNSAWHTVSG